MLNKCLLPICLTLFASALWPSAEAVTRSRVSTSYSYSRYSYGSASTGSSYSYARYTYRYSSSYDSYQPSSIVYTPTTYTYSPSSYSYSYSYYTGLYYTYYYYTYYSYYYGGTCTYTSSGSYTSDTCDAATTTTAAPTTSPLATISCQSGVTLSDSVGWFNSHNAYGTSAYANSMSCSWIIAASSGSIVQLSFVAFNTEKNFDIVNVYDGTSSSATLLGSFHGSSSSDYSYPGATLIYSSGRYMYITFTSDGSITKDGFRALYQQVGASSGSSGVTTTAASTSTSTADPSVTYCSGVRTLSSNATSTIVSHSTASGLMPSQTSGLGSYQNRMNCTWIVPGRSGNYLQFYVVYMNLENCYDKVSIYQEGRTTSQRVFCDASTPIGYLAVVTMTTRGAGATVTFTTDGSVTRQGFLITNSYVTSYDSSLAVGNSSSAGVAGVSSAKSKSNNVCRNYQVNSNGSAMGSFTCPNPFEPSDYTQCCGDENKQYCCKLQDNTPMIVGIIVGIICLVIVLAVVIFCCIRGCRERAATKSGSAVKWRRSLNKAKAITAWKLMSAGRGGGGGVSAVAAARGDLLYANIPADPPTFSPPPVPPPSSLYYSAYPPGNPPAYTTVYPPVQPQPR